MGSTSAYDSRDDVEVAILDALIDRSETGMTVFELRTAVGVDIETLEPALNNLRDDGMITIDYGDDRSIIRPDEKLHPPDEDSSYDSDSDWSIFKRLRERFGN